MFSCAAGHAAAGPWTPETGGLWIVGAIPAVDDDNRHGALELYSETAFGDGRYALVGRSWAEALRTPALVRGEAALSVKRAFVGGRAAAAVEAGAAYRDDPTTACAGFGYDARVSLGRSFANGAYVSSEAGWTAFGADCGFWRGGVSAGLRRGRRLALAQVFYDDGADAQGAVSAQVSTVWRISSRTGLQFGVRAPLDPQPGATASLVVALWRMD